METIKCPECGTRVRLDSERVQCYVCGTDPRQKAGESADGHVARGLSDVIFRVVSAIVFLGALVNLIYGFTLAEGEAKSFEHLILFLIFGPIAAYLVWNGLPTFPNVGKQNRMKGLIDCGIGLVMFALGVGSGFLAPLMAAQFGIGFVAVGLLLGGGAVFSKGIAILVTGRDL